MGCLITIKWDGSYVLTTVVDAMYSISGMDLVKQDAHMRGANVDICSLICDELDTKGGDRRPIMMKAKLTLGVEVLQQCLSSPIQSQVNAI